MTHKQEQFLKAYHALCEKYLMIVSHYNCCYDNEMPDCKIDDASADDIAAHINNIEESVNEAF